MSKSSLTVLLALIVAMTATKARADLTIQIGENNGAPVTAAFVVGSPAGAGGVTGVVGTFTTAHYAINVLASNEEQMLTLSHLVTTNLSIIKLDNSATTLNLYAIGSGFTAPITPPNINVNSQVGGTVVLGSPSDTLNFQSFVGGVSQGVQSPNVTTPQAFANTQNTILTSLSAPYTLSQRFDVFLATTNDQLGLHATTELAPVPEPTAVTLLLFGMIGLGVFGWRRCLA